MVLSFHSHRTKWGQAEEFSLGSIGIYSDAKPAERVLASRGIRSDKVVHNQIRLLILSDHLDPPTPDAAANEGQRQAYLIPILAPCPTPGDIFTPHSFPLAWHEQ
jgi:hypothetical protein